MTKPKVVGYRTKDGLWYLCHVIREKPEGILEVQIPNPAGHGWVLDLWPNEYKVIA